MHIHNSTAHDWKRRRRGGGATPRRPAAGHWRNHCRSSRHRRHSAAGRWDREAVEERRGAPGSGGLLMGDGAMRATSCRIVRHDDRRGRVAPRHSDLDVAESCCVPQTRGRVGWPHASWCSKYGNRREIRATRGAAKRWRCHTVPGVEQQIRWDYRGHSRVLSVTATCSRSEGRPLPSPPSVAAVSKATDGLRSPDWSWSLES